MNGRSCLTSISATFLAACLSPSAHALEGKQCLPMAEMNAALKAEGQHTMIIGNRSALQNPTGKIKDASVLLFMNAVTSNADGSLGYQIEGNRPRDEPSSTVCVAAKLTNIRLFDANRPGIPRDAFLGGSFDDGLRSNEKLGTRPMAEADTLHRNTHGREVLGLPAIVLGNTSHKTGQLYTRMPNGEMQHMMGMSDVEYTPAALEILKSKSGVLAP